MQDHFEGLKQSEDDVVRAGDASRVREVPGFWVIPSIATREGVHQGSAGRGFKSWDELQATYKRLEGKPLVASAHRWAGDKRHIVGIAKNVRLDHRKRAVAYDAHFFREAVSGYDVHPAVLDWNAEKVAQVKGGKPLEQSVGFGFIEDPTPGVFKGQSYDFVQRHMDYEHVAVLEGQQGACSVRQGCMIGADSRSVDTKSAANVYGDGDKEMATKAEQEAQAQNEAAKKAADSAQEAAITERVNELLPGLVSKAVGDALAAERKAAKAEADKKSRSGDERAEDAETRLAAEAAKKAADALGCSIAELPGKVKAGCDQLAALEKKDNEQRALIAGDIAKYQFPKDEKAQKARATNLAKLGMDELVELHNTLLDAATPQRTAPPLTGAPNAPEGPYGEQKDGSYGVKDWSKVNVGWAPARGTAPKGGN